MLFRSIPAAVIILFSLFRVNVEITMSVSILCGAAVTILFQGTAPGELLKIAVFGFFPEQKALAALLSGGGILSMAKVFAIVCLSSCYAGIFSGTGFLDGVREVLCRMSRRISPFGGILAASVLTGMISCNQTLAIMLTHQICGTVETDPERMAVHLENTAVVIAPPDPVVHRRCHPAGGGGGTLPVHPDRMLSVPATAVEPPCGPAQGAGRTADRHRPGPRA